MFKEILKKFVPLILREAISFVKDALLKREENRAKRKELEQIKKLEENEKT